MNAAPATPAAELPPIPDVVETAERMVFRVRSDNPKTPRKTYRVDLLGMEGRCECECKDWDKRRGPALRRGELSLTRKTTCRHVRKAIAHFDRKMLRAMWETQEAGR